MPITDPGYMNLCEGYVFCHKRILEQASVEIKGRIDSEDLDFFQRFSESARETMTDAIRFSEEGHADDLSPEYFEQFVAHVRRMTLYWCAAAVYMMKAIDELLADRIHQESFPAEYVPYLAPTPETPIFERQKDLRRLKKEIGNRTLDEVRMDALLMRDLKHHMEAYAWVGTMNWISDKISIEQIFTQITHMSDTEESHPSFEVPDALRFLAECAGHVGYAKQAGAEYVSMYAYRMRPYMDHLALHFGLTYRELIRLSPDEISSALDHKITKRKLHEIVRSTSRKEILRVLMARAGSSYDLIENPEDISELKKMIPRANEGESQVQGQTGNKGSARGSVKVVMNLEEFHKFEPGDVLVTTMTTPDFVILMQQSSAIVTDIGGVLSHAAIMSRELGKPCVIGTKVATQVLKDGDMVEVDADQGTVRVLERAVNE